MITCQSIKEQRSKILEVAQRYGAHDLRIFGSVARGDQCEDSDLDMVVRFDQDRSLFDHGGLICELEELLGVKVDVVSERGMREQFRSHVAREAVSL